MRQPVINILPEVIKDLNPDNNFPVHIGQPPNTNRVFVWIVISCTLTNLNISFEETSEE